MSAQGQTVKDITMLIQVGEDYVRDVIHAFNERGFDALNPKWNGGRAKTIKGCGRGGCGRSAGAAGRAWCRSAPPWRRIWCPGR
nr:helix-turn-helix domain-containing protein [Streptomyces sp. NBC_01450]